MLASVKIRICFWLLSDSEEVLYVKRAAGGTSQTTHAHTCVCAGAIFRLSSHTVLWDKWDTLKVISWRYEPKNTLWSYCSLWTGTEMMNKKTENLLFHNNCSSPAGSDICDPSPRDGCLELTLYAPGLFVVLLLRPSLHQSQDLPLTTLLPQKSCIYWGQSVSDLHCYSLYVYEFLMWRSTTPHSNDICILRDRFCQNSHILGSF